MMAAEQDNQYYRTRRGQLSAFGRAWASAQSLRNILIVFATFMVLALCLLLWLLFRASGNVSVLNYVAAGITLSIGTVGAVLLVWRYIKKAFIEPDLAFRKWLQQVCDGDLNAHIDLPVEHQHYNELDFHTRNLASSLSQLSTDMDNLVDMQTNRLEQQKAELKLLFDLTTVVSRESELHIVAQTICSALADWFDQVQVSLYKIDSEAVLFLGSARSNTSLGENGSTDLSPVQEYDGETVHTDGKGIYYHEIPKQPGVDPHGEDTTAGYAKVNFFDGDLVAGMIVVQASSMSELRTRKAQRILSTVAEQLTLFVSKYSAVERGQKTLLYQQRGELAAEIHDSLAQTLLATRYQVTMLRESVADQKPEQLLRSIEKIEGSIGEANTELRGLIHEYRSQLSTHRSADSLHELIDQFRERSSISIFFQSKDPLIQFTPREDSVVQSIVAEVLNNAQKYSQASMIRVFLRMQQSGVRDLLIEDDGVGFDYDDIKQRSTTEHLEYGNHIGLCIMHERALSIGAVLSIDSEVSEGTRVTLSLPPLRENLES